MAVGGEGGRTHGSEQLSGESGSRVALTAMAGYGSSRGRAERVEEEELKCSPVGSSKSSGRRSGARGRAAGR